MQEWKALERAVVDCEKCLRLREYCTDVAKAKRRSYADWDYWGRPVPNFGKAPAGLLVVGLAPAAHGANRTGRMFTGDRSGEWLYRALFRAGFANQAHATDTDDGLRLVNCVITAACHCAPPANKPAREELAACSSWLQQTIDLVDPAVVVALGSIAWDSLKTEFKRRAWLTQTTAKFSHGVEVELQGSRLLLGSYHPSQQNTFTGRLTEPMLDAVFQRARQWLSRKRR